MGDIKELRTLSIKLAIKDPAGDVIHLCYMIISRSCPH